MDEMFFYSYGYSVSPSQKLRIANDRPCTGLFWSGKGYGGGGGGKPFAQKNLATVAQIFPKESKRNEGHIATT